MITLRTDAQRRHVQFGEHEIWLTFYPERSTVPSTADLRVLAGFEEIHLAPDGVAAPRPDEDVEVVTYVYKGALAQEDSTGESGVVYAGEFQRLAMGPGLAHEETNASRTVPAHLYRIALHPSAAAPDGAHEQRRFAKAQRSNVLCVVASPDGRKGSLRIVEDALVYSSMLGPGHHLVHELLPGRKAWLHVIHGEASLQDIILNPGDGAGVTLEPSVSLTARKDTEILLIDMGADGGTQNNCQGGTRT